MLTEKRSRNCQCNDASIAPIQMTVIAASKTAHQKPALAAGDSTLPSAEACTIGAPIGFVSAPFAIGVARQKADASRFSSNRELGTVRNLLLGQDLSH